MVATIQPPDNSTVAPIHGSSLDTIRKRDGRVVAFDSRCITKAIAKAGRASGEFDADVAQRLMLRALSLAHATLTREAPTVEQIQDIVEEVLLTSPYKKTAKAYIIYREQHAHIRTMVAQADVELVDRYLMRRDWQVRENSNMAYSLQGLNNYLASEVSKTYWLNKIYSPEVREAHQSGDLHVHDLGQLSVYCVGWDLRDLLLSGFRGAPGKAESRPARHLRTALGQVVNFFYTLQGEAAGAQAFASFDTLLAPFVRADRLSYGDVRQALQEFVFNLNVPTRVGFQTPFTNLTLDLQPPSTLADAPAIVGAELQDFTYGELGAEMRLINEALLEVLAEGDARGRVFTFPIPTVNITADFNWDDPSLAGLWRAAAHYGIPYFANFVGSDLQPDDARSMCCRLRLDLRALEKRGGGLFGANPLTGSIGVVTINMPRLGHLATDERDFFMRLDRMMDIARTSLETKRKVLEGLTERDLYPYTSFYLRDVHKRFGHYWQNHFSTIGLVGMNEACLGLIGEGIGSEAGRALAMRTLDHMRDQLTRFQEETGNLYNLEATPAEGASYRLARLDADRYPGICQAGNRDEESGQGMEPFYTNSTHLPVDFSHDILHVLELQDPLQSRYTGGTVLHVFLGEAAPDEEAVKAFVRTVCARFSLPYFTLSPTFSVCPSHGYLRGEQGSCPNCGAATEVYSRVVGYLRPTCQWNDGKRAEFDRRKHFRVEP